MKIRCYNQVNEGDPLEIYTDTEGEVIFKKYSPIGELSTTAIQYSDVLSKTSGLPVLVCDRDHVIAAAGLSKKEYLERRVSPQLEEIIESRKNWQATGTESRALIPVEGTERQAAVISPIISSGDVSGAVIMLLSEQGTLPGETEIKLVQAAAGFLGKQMEE